jgi:predicted transcriptional regulator
VSTVFSTDSPIDAPAIPKTPHVRENSKQAQMIELLKRPDGATLNQLVEATGWQSHTVRGAMAGSLKKKLGLTIISEKATGQERTYRIQEQGIAA